MLLKNLKIWLLIKKTIRNHAETFDEAIFKQKISEFIEDKYSEFNSLNNIIGKITYCNSEAEKFAALDKE